MSATHANTDFAAAARPTFLPNRPLQPRGAPSPVRPHSPHLPATPHRFRPETRLPEALAAPNPAPSATGSPGLEKPTSCCRQGVRLPLRSAACNPATCRAWQAPELSLLPAARAGTGRAAARETGRPAAPRDPRRPRRRAPTPAPGRPAASAPPPLPLTRAGTVLCRRDRAAREGRGRWPEGEQGGARPAPLRPPPPAKEGKEESGEHNSPRLEPAAARARRRLSLGGGHYARARARRAALPVVPAPARFSPPTRLPAAATSPAPPLLARLRPFRSRRPMAARPHYISARGRGLAAPATPARRELQGTSPSVPGAPPLPRALCRRLQPAPRRVFAVLLGDGPRRVSQVAR
ncbi:uncharacterized protein LOC113600494 [Acinonyx jubatus]|uniref:Uncharacterized protein LOC113600494 n=1 Tax=Acinonyx jubatus TaxID=32536 RepID=A0ABM3NXP5_ACIJB|nr:uncharacterized protein LOC113600494 [Acinonyx jubatus]